MAAPLRPVRPLPSRPAVDTDEGLRTGITARILISLTVILGQLWALTVSLEAYLEGEAVRAWWLAGFSILSAVVVVILVRLEPPPRGSTRPDDHDHAGA